MTHKSSSKRRQSAPDWFLNLLWFVAGIGATGAFWYFLSERNYRVAIAVAIATALVVVCVVTIHVRRDKMEKHSQAHPRFVAYACLLMKSGEHEYFKLESHRKENSHDPWVIHRRARSELMAMLGTLREEQSWVLLVDWLASKPWEDRLEIARNITRRTKALDWNEEERKAAAVNVLSRLAAAGYDTGTPVNHGNANAPSAATLPAATLRLLESLVVAGSNQRRDFLLEDWGKKQRVIRRDL